MKSLFQADLQAERDKGAQQRDKDLNHCKIGLEFTIISLVKLISSSFICEYIVGGGGQWRMLRLTISIQCVHMSVLATRACCSHISAGTCDCV